MDDGLKQRLIGAIVLLALAVIFIPSVFNEDSRRRVDLTSQIPPEPIDTPSPLVVEEPVRPEGISEPPPLENYYPHEEETVESEIASATDAASSAPATGNNSIEFGEDGVVDAWSVQVGSFQSQESADALADRLLTQDYKAYVRSSVIAGETRFRVFVGPKIRREDAMQEKAQLEKLLETQTLLVKFKP